MSRASVSWNILPLRLEARRLWAGKSGSLFERFAEFRSGRHDVAVLKDMMSNYWCSLDIRKSAGSPEMFISGFTGKCRKSGMFPSICGIIGKEGV